MERRRLWALLALALLPGPALGGDCGAPPNIPFAQLQEEFQSQTDFPVGTTVKYSCRPGYMKIPGVSNRFTCENDFKWSPAKEFCQRKSCASPGHLEHGSINITDLLFGSEITFSCESGYRLVGLQSSRCVISDQKLMWDRELPLCEGIPCLPPPKIENGRHSGELDVYTYGSSVTYSCDAVPGGAHPFSLIGEASIYCTSAPNKTGVWSGDPPECKVVECGNVEVKNGRKRSGFGPSYTYQNAIVFECNRGYQLVGDSTVVCQADNSWAPPIPSCEETATTTLSTCETPVFSNGKVVPSKHRYVFGDDVTLICKTNYAFSNNATSMVVLCRGDNVWRPPVELCHALESPDHGELSIKNGKALGEETKYSIGDIVTIECYPGYTLHGATKIQYIGKKKWEPEVPECQLSTYIIVIICAIVITAVVLLCVWLYKRYFSQEGKRSSTLSATEYSMCKA